MHIDKLFNNLKVSRKLMLISLSFSLPVVVLLFVTIQTINKDIQFADYKMFGNRYQRPLEDLLRWLPVSDRGSSSEDVSVRATIDQTFELLEQVDRDIGPLLQFADEGLGKRGRTHVKLQNVTREWNELHAGHTPLSAAARHDKHAHLISDVRTMISHAGDTSNLILDPDLDTYYTMDVTLLALPHTQHRLATILSEGDRALSGSLSSKDRVQMAVYAALLKEADLDRVIGSLGTALNEDVNFHGISESLQRNIPPALKKYQANTEAFLGLIARLGEGDPGVGRTDFLAAGLAAQEASFALWTAAEQELNAMLLNRIHILDNRKLAGLERQPILWRHRSGHIEQEHKVSRWARPDVERSCLKADEGETMRGIPRTRGQLGRPRTPVRSTWGGETAKATEDISRTIGTIQTDAKARRPQEAHSSGHRRARGRRIH